ncbi:MAG: cytochrome c3 family protein [Phycisphaerales bacterium]|nr:MAG: cytochrome c3 family protein [Phycisphaerales bacterium]
MPRTRPDERPESESPIQTADEAGAGDGAESPPETADRQMPYKPKYRPLWNNTITIFGLFLAVMAVMLLLTFGLFHLVSPAKNPYVDIVGFLILPGILVIGLVIVPFGILFKSWRIHRREPEQHLAFRFPHIDLNDPAQRKVAKFFTAGTFFLLPMVGVSSYHGYHYTDSAGFCAQACHSVMEPEATTYESSSHARVACAECHIGSGASWFVKSKLSGTRQVLAMMQDSYSRPIPPAIQHLRPARETCEQCHWPKKFFGAQLREIVYFTSDEQNTRREIDMLVKTGGGDEASGRAEGIHKHMALSGTIEYVATDDKLQEIPWVRYTTKVGEVLIYRSDGRPSSDPRPEGQLKVLDCMDCHNRPAHNFLAPIDAVDLRLEVGALDDTLPYIKREAVEALAQPYPDADSARQHIGAMLSDFYRQEYPEIWQTRRVDIYSAIDSVRTIYDETTFPDMKVNWQTYPDNIGHKISPGCFRCHEGKHVNQHGEKISHSCDICHTFLNPVVEEDGRTVVQRGPFVHPVPLEGLHAELRCDKCHTGGPTPEATCTGCHTAQEAFRAGTHEAFADFDVPAEPMYESVSCEECHDLSQPTSLEAIDEMCMDCHDDEEYEGMLASWQQELEPLMRKAEERAHGEDLEVLKALKAAGPMHNLEASRKILHEITGGTEKP